MKHFNVYLTAVILLLGASLTWSLASEPAAPMQSSEPKTRSVVGRVVESTGTYLTIRAANDEQVTFSVEGVKKLPVGRLVDATVKVEYRTLADGTSRTVAVTRTNEPATILNAAANSGARVAALTPRARRSAIGHANELQRAGSALPKIGFGGLMLMGMMLTAAGLVVRTRSHTTVA